MGEPTRHEGTELGFCAVDEPPCLVGSPMMLNQLFESWREWVEVTRRSKDSKKPLGRDSFKGARVIWGGGSRPGSASGEIISCLEQS